MNQQRQPDEWSEPIPELESFEEAAALARSVEIPVMKVNQLDSGALDVELHNLLKLQLAPTFSMFSKGFLDEYKPEIEAIFSFVFWRCTVWDQIPTPGMRLQNLRYRDETAVKHAPIGSNPLFVPGFAEPRYSQRLSWGIISVGAPWIMGATRRFGLSHGWSHAPSRSPKRIAWTFLSKLQQFYRVASVLNTLVFLYSGYYPTVLDRLLKLRMIYERQNVESRQINYAFISRQLLWDHFAEFVGTITPMLVSLSIAHWWGAVQRGIWGEKSYGKILQDQKGACPECGAEPTREPYVTNCGHVFCYYCLRVACYEDPNYRCIQCQTLVSGSKPWIETSSI